MTRSQKTDTARSAHAWQQNSLDAQAIGNREDISPKLFHLFRAALSREQPFVPIWQRQAQAILIVSNGLVLSH